MKFKYHRWFQALVVPLVALAFHIFFGYRVIGRENIPEGGCVVCPNHVQLSDPPFAAVALGGKTPIRLMAKKGAVPEEDIRVADRGARRFSDRPRGRGYHRHQDRARLGSCRSEAHHLPAGHTPRRRGRNQERCGHAGGQDPGADPADVYHRGASVSAAEPRS